MTRPHFAQSQFDPLLTTSEVAQRMGVSLRTVQLWVDAGLLAAGRTPGGHRRIRQSAVTALAGAGGIPVAAPDVDVRGLAVDLVAALRALVVELQDSSSREMTQAREVLVRADAMLRGAP